MATRPRRRKLHPIDDAPEIERASPEWKARTAALAKEDRARAAAARKALAMYDPEELAHMVDEYYEVRGIIMDELGKHGDAAGLAAGLRELLARERRAPR